VAGPNEINVGRYGKILGKILGLRERNPSGEIATEIFPNITLENDRPEWLFLANERLCRAGDEQSGVAGQVSACALTANVNTNVLGVVDHFLISTNSAQLIQVGLAAALLATVNNCRILDARDPKYVNDDPLQCTLQSSKSTTATTFLSANRTIAEIRLPTNGTMRFDGPFILFGGPASTSIVVQGTTANTAIGVSWAWRERTIDPSELLQG